MLNTGPSLSRSMSDVTVTVKDRKLLWHDFCLCVGAVVICVAEVFLGGGGCVLEYCTVAGVWIWYWHTRSRARSGIVLYMAVCTVWRNVNLLLIIVTHAIKHDITHEVNNLNDLATTYLQDRSYIIYGNCLVNTQLNWQDM